MESLVESYLHWLDIAIDEKGVEISHGLVLGDDDKLTVFALAVPPTEAYHVMLAEWASKRPKEIIFALDRFAKTDQGTTLPDLMAGHHFVRGESSRPFIVEYQHSPRVRRPIEWNNRFWNGALTHELASAIHMLGAHR